ncbi:hypothetical protein D3C78_1132470 [compost metagenome]
MPGFEHRQEETLAQVPGGDVTLGKRCTHHQRQGIAAPTNRLAIAVEQQILGDHLHTGVAESVQHLPGAFDHLEAMLKGCHLLDPCDMTPPLEQRPRLFQSGFLQLQRAVGRQRHIRQIARQAVHEPWRLALEQLPLDDRVTAGHSLFGNAVGQVFQRAGSRVEMLVIQRVQAEQHAQRQPLHRAGLNDAPQAAGNLAQYVVDPQALHLCVAQEHRNQCIGRLLPDTLTIIETQRQRLVEANLTIVAPAHRLDERLTERLDQSLQEIGQQHGAAFDQRPALLELNG